MRELGALISSLEVIWESSSYDQFAFKRISVLRMSVDAETAGAPPHRQRTSAVSVLCITA
jgi:hypothetical protein